MPSLAGSRKTWLLLPLGIVALFWLAQTLAIHQVSLAKGRGGLAPLELGSDDGAAYHRLARFWAFGEPLPAEFAHTRGAAYANIYPVILAALMRFAGIESVLVFKLLNLAVCLAGVWCAGQLVLAVSRFETGGEPTAAALAGARWLMLALAFYPSFCMFGFSFSLYRDGWVYTCFLACCLLLAKVYTAAQGRGRGWMLGFFAAIGGLYLFRWYMAMAMLATCAGVYGLDRWLSRRQNRARRIGFSAAFAGVCLALLGGMMFRLKSEPQVNSIAGVLLYRNGYRGAVAASETVNNAAVTARSPYGRPADGNLGIYYSDHSAWRWPALYAYSLLSNACGPLLWQVKNIRMGLAVPEGLAILGLFSYLVACWRRTDRILRLFTIQAVAWLLLVGFINDNIGTAMRLRAPAIMLLMVCGAVVHYRGRQPAANRESDGSRTAAAERGQRRIDGGRHDTAGENGQPRGKHAASPLAAVDGIR